jgi:hypothetical protein
VDLTLQTGETLEIRFDRAPTVNDVLDIVAWTEGPRPDAGAAVNRVSLRVGRPGGFSGFDEAATSRSGKLTVNAVTADSATKITSLKATLDAQLDGAVGWAGVLSGSW